MLTVCEYTVCTSDFETTLYLISSQGHNIAIQATIKVPLRWKFCMSLFLQILKIDVPNRYHANLYLKIPTGTMIILT